MKFKPWQPQELHDRLVEVGPSEANLEYTKFGYLEFRGAGRVRNVTVITDLASKLKETLGSDNAAFHLIHGQHMQTGDATSMLVAVGREGGPVYSTDLKGRGFDETVRQTERTRKKSTMLHYVGIAVTLLSIPLILAIIGGLLVPWGIHMWRNGKASAAMAQYQLDLYAQVDAMVGRIPGVRLV